MEEAEDSYTAQSQYGVWLARLISQIDRTLIQVYYKRSFALMMQFVDNSRPSPPSQTPRVSSPVVSSKSAVAETSGLTDVLGNMSAGSSSNIATVFSATDLVGDEDADSDD